MSFAFCQPAPSCRTLTDTGSEAGGDEVHGPGRHRGEMAALESQFHDDHFHILDEFLGLTGDP